MPETEPTRSSLPRWKRFTYSVSTKLIVSLLTAMVAIFALLGYLNIQLHRKHLEAATLSAAERVSDLIKRSTNYEMLHNNREGLYHVMKTIAEEPGVAKVRIFDREGRITYSTDASEVNHVVDKTEEACFHCHAQSQPLAHLNRPDRFRIYRNASGERVLGVINPIENQASCSNADCHAHPAAQRILGVLDTDMSLAKADAQLAESTRRMVIYTIFALVLIAALSWLFVWRVVGVPIKTLEAGTERLSKGELGYQIYVGSRDEVGDLACSFNTMSVQLRDANAQIVAWTKTLEDRVARKSQELQRAHDHALRFEKMASIGKMAAVVAHEINNPLSGILTYAKLLRKWVERGEAATEKRAETAQCLELIAAESRRCGDLVKNLLTFSRTSAVNIQPSDLNAVIERALRLVQHQLELANIHLQLDLSASLPLALCDAPQIEQVMLALIQNAIDAMPKGGNLWLATRTSGAKTEIEIEVRDDGMGIPPEILPQIFEPFLTTKESGHGVGLGLAISRSIMEQHNGRIAVHSEVGKGTRFNLSLPVAMAVDAAAKREGLVVR
ncbi:MAG TPA: ATP-binding protein [Terriglobales bacterium]|nr:ATP-binding protein [Terriglobales bacterium]